MSVSRALGHLDWTAFGLPRCQSQAGGMGKLRVELPMPRCHDATSRRLDRDVARPPKRERSSTREPLAEHRSALGHQSVRNSPQQRTSEWTATQMLLELAAQTGGRLASGMACIHLAPSGGGGGTTWLATTSTSVAVLQHHHSSNHYYLCRDALCVLASCCATRNVRYLGICCQLLKSCRVFVVHPTDED